MISFTILALLKLLQQNWRGKRHHVVIKLWQNLFKQEEKYYILRSMS
jgi:hypothetical protein